MTLPGVRDRFLEVDGLRLHLLDWGGDGPLVFCIHANGYLAAMWHPIALELTAAGTRRRRRPAGARRQRAGAGLSLGPPVGVRRRRAAGARAGAGRARRAFDRRHAVRHLRRAASRARAGDGAGRRGRPAGAVLSASGKHAERPVRHVEAASLLAVAGGDAGVAGVEGGVCALAAGDAGPVRAKEGGRETDQTGK